MANLNPKHDRIILPGEHSPLDGCKDPVRTVHVTHSLISIAVDNRAVRHDGDIFEITPAVYLSCYPPLARKRSLALVPGERWEQFHETANLGQINRFNHRQFLCRISSG